MKVCHVSYSDIVGGAARASYRICKCLVDYKSDLHIETVLRVLDKNINESFIHGYRPKNEFILWPLIRKKIQNIYFKNNFSKKPVGYSIAWPSTGLGKELNSSDADILNLHFIGNDTLSIEEIARLKKPIVWTFHDMWAFCGAEHYFLPDENNLFYNDGKSFSSSEQPIDYKLNYKTWSRKQKYWKKPFTIITPSKWMHDVVKDSYIFNNSDIHIIPYPINTDIWFPVHKHISREFLGLDREKKYILFGAVAGALDPRKGGDLLIEALNILRSNSQQVNNIELIVFGQSHGNFEQLTQFRTHYFGHLHDDISLRALYTASDVMIVPSRQDNLPNTAIESIACGTPVVCFNIGGMPDIIQHQFNGFLADPFNIEELSNGIESILSNQDFRDILSINARKYAVDNYNPKLISSKYADIYYKVLHS
jgi:glycosyltransferase involved in cell wall biosynthesis